MATPEPVFTQVGTTPLYWLDPATTVAGFLASSLAQASPTLTETWGDAAGVYVLLGQAPTDVAAFTAALQGYLASFPTPGARFLWIQDPNAGFMAWNVQSLVLQSTTQGGTTTWTIARLLSLPFSDYALTVRAGGTIAPAEVGDAGWGFQLGNPPLGAATTLFTPDATFDGASGTAMLAFAESAAGAWRFRLDLAATDLAPLGCAIRYFTGDPVTGDVQAVSFGVLTTATTAGFSLYATLDPLRPLVGSATQLGFSSWLTPGSGQPTFQSGFATSRGYPVNLQAQATAGLVFAVAPYFSAPNAPTGYYLAPQGAFGLQVVPPAGVNDAGIDRLICGASGIEYLSIPALASCGVVFVAGQPAYAPLLPDTAASQTLTAQGTTSWLYATGPSGIQYYAQPEDAPLYTAPASGLDETTPLLDYLEIPAITPAAAMAFPMAPFRDLAAGQLAAALRIEQGALAPLRRQLLMTGASNVVPPVAPTTQVGVTPQGLAIGVSAAGDWNWAAIGQNATTASEPDLRFTNVTGDFKQALLTNNLFMVLGDPDAILGSDDGQRLPMASVAYQLTATELTVIGELPTEAGVPPAVLQAVKTYYSGQGYPVSNDLADFKSKLRTASPGITDDQIMVFRRFAGLMTPVIGDWTFRMSPDNWKTPDRQTYLIYKFVVGRSLQDLAGDVSSWVWPGAVAQTPDGLAAASKAIATIIGDAAKHDGPGSFYARFNQVAADVNWTGVIALSVDVPLDDLPAELQALAAGIDPRQFSAHHLGFAATPYQLAGSALTFSRSAVFGLIDYENPEDQYFSSDIPYAFRVQQLAVGFENSIVTTFAARVQLLVNRLFGAPTRLFPSIHGNNVILLGAHQRQTLPDGTSHDTYVFSMPGENVFQIDGLVLQTATLLSTQLVTTQAVTPGGTATEVKATFQMTGNLAFYEPDGFDPFCWGLDDQGADGYLRFGNLAIDMSFQPGNPAGTTVFTLRDGNLAFDLANSVARANSLVQRFPVRLARLITTPDPVLTPGSPTPSPEDLGFVSVSAPIDQSKLTAPWYGLDYTIDLGTLGALGNSVGLTLEVLAAWSPGEGGNTPAVYIGVKLPGTKEAFGVSMPLQGFMTLGFRTIELVVDNEAGQPRTYTLRLRDFALKLLGLSFPPGHNNISLFGNPDQTGPAKVGWYAAYTADGDSKQPSTPPTRRLVRQSRLALRPGERS